MNYKFSLKSYNLENNPVNCAEYTFYDNITLDEVLESMKSFLNCSGFNLDGLEPIYNKQITTPVNEM